MSILHTDDAEEDPHPEMYVPFEWNQAKQTIRQAVAML
jgi:hypothetical protein